MGDRRTASWVLGALATAALLAGCTGCGHLAGGDRTAPAAAVPAASPADCVSGVVKDDGTVETGYGFVPSATDGVYVQRFSAAELARGVDRACVCLLKTRPPHDADFEVVFFADEGGRPAAQPFAAVPGRFEAVPASVAEAGRLVEVDVSSVELPAADVHAGVRWDPSKNAFLFVCTDTSEGTEKTEVHFREDRAPGWTSVETARDPIFRPHRAILFRLAGSAGG